MSTTSKQPRRRVQATTGRGKLERKVPNLYRYDYTDASGTPRITWFVGYKRNRKQHMVKLDVQSVGFEPADLTEAKRARDKYLVGLDEGRIAQRDTQTFADSFVEWQASRSLAERTRSHEQHLLDRHLADLKARRVQTVTASEVAKLLRGMRDSYSPWTQTAVYRLLKGTFAHAARRGTLTRSPVDGLAPSELPKQRNARAVRRLSEVEIATLVAAVASERWKAAVGLAGYAGLRLGEIRGLRWRDVDLDANEVSVRGSLLPDGTPKATKTEAGERTVAMLPALRRLLVAWRLRSPRTADDDLVICSIRRDEDGRPVAERNLRRALEAAVTKAGLEVADSERLSWHALRHSAGSTFATDLELPATTLARFMGHTDPGFTLKVYARDARKQADVTADVLARAAAAGVGV